MSSARTRLSQVASHIHGSSVTSASSSTTQSRPVNFHSLSPTAFLPRAAAIEPDALAIYHVSANKQIVTRSYKEFADQARGLAYFLKEKGYKRVGILCPNTPAFLQAIFAIAAAGAVNVAVNYRLNAEDVAYILDHAEAEVVIVDSEFVPLLAAFRASHASVRLIIDHDLGPEPVTSDNSYEYAVHEGLRYDLECGADGWEGLEIQSHDEEGLIALAYTSGTTARPKGVEYTHRGAYLAALANIIESGLNAGPQRCRYLWTLPMFHAMGWTFPWAVTAVRGTHYCLRKIDYTEIWRLLKHEHITHYNAAPTVNTLLCNAREAERLPRPVRVTVAASPPTPKLFAEMSRINLMPVHVYGLTETYGPITKGYYMPAWDGLPSTERYGKMARQGHGFITSLPVRVIRTDRPEGDIVDVAQDGKEMGEVVFSGNICAKGYYKDAEATRKLFAGGLLHSGDLAVWHPDGAIQIMDRAKDIIISGGENISSVALESLLVSHPDVVEVAVVAVPDLQWGERPKAFVTIRSGATVTGAAIIEWSRHQRGISRFMIPREVEVVDELPKTSTGKVQKNVLRARGRSK